MKKSHPAPNKKINFFHLILFIIGSELLGSLGSFATIPNIPTWYQSLTKPAFNPPNWIFGPVWTILFALMGIAAYLVWREGWKKNAVKEALTVFAAQFSYNILWSFVFFGLNSPIGGIIVIAILWGLIILTIRKFFTVSQAAAFLLIPYILWVSFAAFLNIAIANLNP